MTSSALRKGDLKYGLSFYSAHLVNSYATHRILFIDYNCINLVYMVFRIKRDKPNWEILCTDGSFDSVPSEITAIISEPYIPTQGCMLKKLKPYFNIIPILFTSTVDEKTFWHYAKAEGIYSTPKCKYEKKPWKFERVYSFLEFFEPKRALESVNAKDFTVVHYENGLKEELDNKMYRLYFKNNLQFASDLSVC